MIQEEFIKMKEKLKKKYKKIKAGKKEWYLVIFIVVITTFYGYYLELSLLFVFFLMSWLLILMAAKFYRFLLVDITKVFVIFILYLFF